MWMVETGTLRFLQVNDAALRLYGYSRAEMLLMSIGDLRPTEPLEAVQADYEALIGGLVPSLDRRHRKKNGEYLDVQVNAHPAEHQGSRVLVGVIVDITARKRAEEQLRLNQKRFDAVLESAMDAVVGIDEHDTVTLWNKAAEGFFGWTAIEAVGRILAELIVPERYRRSHLNGIRRYLETGVPTILGSRIEIEAIDKWGREFPVELTLCEVSEPGDLRFSAYIRDISERKAKDAALRESEQRLRFMAEAMPQKVFTAGPDGNVDYLNPQWGEFTGLSIEEMIGWGWTQFIHPDDVVENVRLWEHSVQTCQPFEFEHRFRRKDGEYRWHVTRALPRRGDDGRPVMWVGSNTDIHEQKVRERTLTFLSQLSEATKPLGSPEQIMQTTAKMLAEHLDVDRCAYAEVEDQAMFVITGDYARGVPSIVGRWPVAAFGRECVRQMLEDEPYVVEDTNTDPRITAEDMEAYRATTIRSVICLPLHKEGRFTAAMAVHQTTPRRWSPEEIGLVQTVVARCWESLERARTLRDLSESESSLRLVNERLEHERNRLAALLQKVPAAIAVVRGPDFVFEMANEMYVQMVGPRQLLGKPVREALPELEGQGFMELLDTVFRTAEPFVGREMPSTLLDSAGRAETVYVDFVYQPIHEPDGSVSGVLGFGVDVTDKVLARNAVERMNEELEEKVRGRTAELEAANRELEGFTYNVGHDFRSPLRAISAMSSILIADYGDLLPEEALDLLQSQAQAARKLWVLTEDLLRLSRLSKEPLTVRTVDLSRIVSEVISEADSHDHIRFEVEQDMQAQADANLLKIVLDNLVGNAIKFSPQGGTVRVGKGIGGEFFVRDEGVGFEQEYAARMFEPFQRLVKDSDFPGSGVGLTNVKRIIERHGGRVWAESPGLGKGATVFFTLPL